MNQTAEMETGNAVLYRSQVTVESEPGAIKMVHLPIEAEPVPMGVHTAIAQHYKLAEGQFTPRASTLDYIVGATAGCLMGTLSRALAGSKIPVSQGRLRLEATGEIESDEGVLVIRRIAVVAHLKANPERRADAERIIATYAMQCPVYRTLHTSIDINTTLEFEATI